MSEFHVQDNGDGTYTHTITSLSPAQMVRIAKIYGRMGIWQRIKEHLFRCAVRRERRRKARR